MKLQEVKNKTFNYLSATTNKEVKVFAAKHKLDKVDLRCKEDWMEIFRLAKLEAFSKDIMNLEYEVVTFMNKEGEIKSYTQYSPNEVDLTSVCDELLAFNPVIATHNHPNNSPLSLPDLESMLTLNLKRQWAVCPNGEVYEFKNTGHFRYGMNPVTIECLDSVVQLEKLRKDVEYIMEENILETCVLKEECSIAKDQEFDPSTWCLGMHYFWLNTFRSGSINLATYRVFKM
jgi:hypothetical protein